ncbi:unnamed protein product [Zymoseptoria tritici ST99CH_3D1]|uniref:BTB domain-containing protein n=1 Tax=Zymoseptoria tritici ST99CH_1E4 TaxID=1276532 RepID=A0A2H1G686_ZYMTR|nr:unnamed protein product [Zymoseptoria tritici ST99CH_1E4]SMR50246.1 unnamed protein product [Zymoseptoria tritici ST99CH_3D1]
MANPSSMTPEDGLKIGLANLFKSGDFSDFTIKCGPYHFEVHKAVICAQSEFFKAACKTNSFKEGRDNTITLDTSDKDDPSCDDPEAIKLLVHFFYFLDYEVSSAEVTTAQPLPALTSSSSPPSAKRQRTSTGSAPSAVVKLALPSSDKHMLAHAKVFAAAVKYHVGPLRAMAAAKFKAAVTSGSTHTSFAETITVVYESTADDVRELRDIVEDALMKDKSFLIREDIETAVSTANGLAFALLRKAMTPATKVPATPKQVAALKCRVCADHRKFVTSSGHSVCESCFTRYPS